MSNSKKEEDLEDAKDTAELLELRRKHSGEKGVPLEEVLAKYGV